MLTKIIKLSSVLRRPHLRSLLWIFLALCFVVGMVVQPRVVYEGATIGLMAWWNIVFPSLLPFFIASEILMQLGLVRFLGVVLEPIMRPLFNVPGAGAFVMVIGFTSGFPIGSMVTAKIREQGLCTRLEAERLMSFTNNSSPLFMLTAVSVGMFGRPELGLVIAGAHYLANLFLGLCLRFYGREREMTKLPSSTHYSLRQALRALLNSSQGRQPLGQLLGEAVASSVTKLLNIGGFIILFAVIIKLLNQAGVIDLIASVLGIVLIPLGFTPEILTALASGFFEMTIGTKLASEATGSELQRLMTVGLILGWSGLSIHAQVASMISKTDIRMGIFVCTRVAHAILAAFFTWLMYKPEGSTATIVLPALSTAINHFAYSPSSIIVMSLVAMLISLFILIVLGLLWQLVLSLNKLIFR